MMAGLLLAAGKGRRFGGHKLLAPLPDGRPVAVAALQALAAGVDVAFAVIRPEDEPLARALTDAGARLLRLPEAARGMGASLAFGIRATARAQGWLILPGDMPWVRPQTVRAVADHLRRHGGIVAPLYAGRRGHPVGFDPAFFRELAGLTGDEGARRLLALHADRLGLLPCDDPGVLLDVDTPADLTAGV